MNDGRNASGIMPPPNMHITTMLAQAAPLTAASVLPITDISIIRPVKPMAMDKAAITSSGGLASWIPRMRPRVIMAAMTAMTAMIRRTLSTYRLRFWFTETAFPATC